MRTFGIIGYPLSHSHSPALFTEKFRREHISGCEYYPYPLKHLSDLPGLFRDYPTLEGLNVTIPYKVSVMALLDELDDTAQEVGAVNTIKIFHNISSRPGVTALPGQRLRTFFPGRRTYFLKGFNTDIYGFEKSIKPLLTKNHRTALILGTGGAGRAVAYVFRNMRIKYLFVTRELTLHKINLFKHIIEYKNITKKIMRQYHVIVNATPMGMFPSVNDMPPIPYHLVTDKHILFDLIYNPAETNFLHNGKKHGAVIKNGLEMLTHQLERTWEIWNEDNKM
ncbi:MAG: shikimate dehydrogenase [Bacteroidetes bacterium]|nr:shikimate dehydrogenase [Bacteroidota bacterium]